MRRLNPISGEVRGSIDLYTNGYVSGWVTTSGSPICRFEVILDGVVIAEGKSGYERLDLARTNSQLSNAGFALRFPPIGYTPEKLSLRLMDGRTATEICVDETIWKANGVGRIEGRLGSQIYGWMLDTSRLNDCWGLLQPKNGISSIPAHASIKRDDLLRVFGANGPSGFSIDASVILARNPQRFVIQLLKPQSGAILDEYDSHENEPREPQSDANPEARKLRMALDLQSKFGHFRNPDLLKLRNPGYHLLERIGHDQNGHSNRVWGSESIYLQLNWLENFRPLGSSWLNATQDRSAIAVLAQTLRHLAAATPGAHALTDIDSVEMQNDTAEFRSSKIQISELQLRILSKWSGQQKTFSEEEVAILLADIVAWSRQLGDGTPLVSKQQASWLCELVPNETGSIMLTRYAIGRHSNVQHWRESFNLRMDVDRLAFLVEFCVDELVNAGSASMLGTDLLSQVLPSRISSPDVSLLEMLKMIVFTGSELSPSGNIDSMIAVDSSDAYQEWNLSLRHPHPLGPAVAVKSDSQSLSHEHDIDVSVVGLVGSESGLGYVARSNVEALSAMGASFESDEVDFSAAQPGRSFGEISHDLGAIVVLHAQPDAVPGLLSYASRRLTSTQSLVGVQAWETSNLPDELIAGTRLMDEIWTISNYCAEVFSEATEAPVRVLRLPIDIHTESSLTRSDLELSDDQFVVCYSFDAHSSIDRKNPQGILRAFQLAAQPDWRLLLKVRNYEYLTVRASEGHLQAQGVLESIAKDSRIVLVTQDLNREDNLRLIQMSNVYASLHRSEGFGYTMAEAMALGVPTIGTGYSGNLDFMRTENAWLCEYKLRDVRPGEYPYWNARSQWSEPDIEHASELLRIIASGSSAVTLKTQQAISDMSSGWNMESCRDTFIDAYRHVGLFSSGQNGISGVSNG